jgi:cytochrome c553
MKTLKLTAAALFGVVLASTGAFAFHDGGVAECAGCHTMHNSQDGVDITDPGGYPYLLKAANSTDQCLSCHASYGQFYNGDGWGPGGDFYWLKQTFTWSAHGSPHASTGDSHGHNVISPANGILADQTLLTAPGGTFDSDQLTCTSCHDPHGNQNFNLLYDSTLGPIYPGGRYNFTADAPIAWGNGRRTFVGSGGEETNSQHTIYGSGMSDWCANCHTNFHSDNTTNFVHDVEEDLNGLSSTYNAYVSSDDLTGGSQGTAYWGLVPFEDVDADSTLDPGNYTAGPAANDQVMCLTCHRAHASAFPDIARWDMAETFIADSHPQATDGGVGANDLTNMYYGYTFVQNQRSLCNKCHAKDMNDAGY